jgi:ethanolamine ammonia-lyase large subunit
LSVRLQPNHPTDDAKGIAASIFDGLLYGAGDAVIGINPVSDSVSGIVALMQMVDEVRARFDIPTQSCVLSHVTNQIRAIEQGAPADLVFQSIGGTEQTNRGFGIDLALLQQAHDAAQSLQRGTVGQNVMYFETGQRAVGRCPRRRGPADLRGARLRDRAPVSAAAHQHGGRLHRAGVPL